MSARILHCLWACLMAALPAEAIYSDEHFAIVRVEELADDNGKITFTGEVINTSEFQAVSPSQIFITVKRAGAVLAIVSAGPDSYDPIQPGQTATFAVKSDFEQGQYDDFSVRFVGYIGQSNPNSESLTGAMVLVEESLNFTTFGPDSTAVVLGELRNDTNGILTNINLEFRLFKDEDCLVGIATPSPSFADPGSMLYQDIVPGSTIGFIAYSEAHLSKIKRWEYSLGYELVRLAPVPEHTAIEAATWGQIKAMGR